MGVLLLILGTGSLIFQYSSPVEVYAQVDVGPFWNMGPNMISDRSNSLDTDSDGTDIYPCVPGKRNGV